MSTKTSQSDSVAELVQAAKASRRRFLESVAATGLAAGIGPFVLTRPARAAGTLNILQWSHFIPAYDEWFNGYAKAWGEQNDVAVTVDHVSIADLPTAMASEVSAGAGHDLVELGPAAAQFEPSLVDLADINQEALSRFGPQTETSKRYSYNPVTEKYFAFCHGWTIDPGDYRKSLWEAAGKADGPTAWEDLVTYGAQIMAEQGVPVGIGMSQEYDSNMAHRALMYSFDTSLQSEDAKVVLGEGDHFKLAVDSVKYVANLFKTAMTPEVFAWNAASNNQTLIAGRSSYILNSISAYRAAQRTNPEIAKDIYFTPALKGPGGSGWHCAHVVYDYVIPEYSPSIDLAKQFIMHLAENYDLAMYNSQLYNTPSFVETPIPAGGRDYSAVENAKVLGDLHQAWFTNDPFKLEDEPDGKLLPLIDGLDWTTNVGHPGSSNPATGEVWNTFLIPNMMARVARDQESAEDSVRRTAAEAEEIYAGWRERGLI